MEDLAFHRLSDAEGIYRVMAKLNPAQYCPENFTIRTNQYFHEQKNTHHRKYRHDRISSGRLPAEK